jgi:hypothetical protein
MVKGQMFLIIGIITITVIVMIRTSVNIASIVENKQYIESGLERKQFDNIRDEILKSVSMSYYKGNMSDNVVSFIRFVRDSLRAELVEFKGFVVESVFPNVTADANTTMNITLLNILGLDATVNMTFNSTSKRFTIVDDGAVQTSFVFNTSSDYNYTLSVFYSTAYENRTENTTIPVEVGKSKFIGFFDLKMISTRLEQSDRFTKTYVL